jgi:hypothetical protein
MRRDLLPERRQNFLRENVGIDVDDFRADVNVRKLFVGVGGEKNSEPILKRNHRLVAGTGLQPDLR